MASKPSEEDIDEYIGRFTTLMPQPLDRLTSPDSGSTGGSAHAASSSARGNRYAYGRGGDARGRPCPLFSCLTAHERRPGDDSRAAAGHAGLLLDTAAEPWREHAHRLRLRPSLARRVRVLWTRAGLLWLLGAAWALSLGVWSCQIIGVAAEPIPFSLGYDGLGSLLAWGAAIVACAAGLGAVSGRVATPARLGFGAFALGTGVVGAHALALAPLGSQPGIIWRLLPLIAAVAGAAGEKWHCMMGLGAFFRGGDRTRPATLPWQLTAALVLGATLVVSEQLVISAADTRPANRRRPTPARSPRRPWCFWPRPGSISLLLLGLIFSILEARLRKSLRRVETELQRQLLSRRPDPPAQSPDVRRHPGAGGAASRAERRADGAAVHRPGRLQDGQRHVRPPHGRPHAARDRGAPEALSRARRPDRASRRRWSSWSPSATTRAPKTPASSPSGCNHRSASPAT